MRKMILAALLFLALSASVMAAMDSYPPGTSSKTALACGASPCAVNGNSVAILQANTTRSSAMVQNASAATTMYCCLHATTCTTVAYEFVVAAGTSYTIGGQQGSIWKGGVTCATASSISVAGYDY